MGCSSSQNAPAWVLPTGCSPSGTGCSSLGPHGVTSPASKPAPARAPLSTGPQVLAGACSSSGIPQGHSLLWAYPPALVWSRPWAAGGYLLHSGPPWAADNTLPHHGLHHELQGKSSLLWCLEYLLPPSFTDFGFCRVVSFTQSHSSLLTAVPQWAFTLFKHIITKVLPPLLIGLALASGGFILEPAGTGSIRHGGSF